MEPLREEFIERENNNTKVENVCFYCMCFNNTSKSGGEGCCQWCLNGKFCQDTRWLSRIVQAIICCPVHVVDDCCMGKICIGNYPCPT